MDGKAKTKSDGAGFEVIALQDLEVPNSKVCSKCGELRDLTDFNKDLRATDGYRSDCKFCRREDKRISYAQSKLLDPDMIQNALDKAAYRVLKELILGKS